MWEKACYSNYDLILSKQYYFDEKILAKKKKGTKQMNRTTMFTCDDRCGCFNKFIKENIKCGLSKNYLTITFLLISSFPSQ